MSADDHDGPGEPNIVDRTLDRIDAFHRGVAPLAVAHGVIKKFGDDRGGQMAMLLTYRGFFSLFPLLLAFVNVVGLLLADNEELRDRLIDSTVSSVPIVGNEIAGSADALGGNWFVAVGAVLVSVWAGLGLLEMLQEALNNVWGVPRFRRPSWIIRKLRDVPGAVLIGLCLVLSGGSAWLFGSHSGPGVWLAGLVLPFAAGALCYLGLHWLLCVRKVPFVAQLPGATFIGAAWLALQTLGTWYVDRFVLRSSDTYGVFVIVFGLLSWSYLLGMFYLYANELSVVLHDRRWPRSITGRNLTDADQDALALILRNEVRVEGVGLDVEVPRLPR